MNYKYRKLDNGLRVVAVNTPEFKSIRIQIWLHGGSALEDKSNAGISHFVEHMVLSGSEDFPDKDKFDELSERLGAGYNGHTTDSRVGLSISVPDTYLDLGIHFLHQACFHATFPKDYLENERLVILDEIHNYNTRPYKKYLNYWDRVRYEGKDKPLSVIGSKTQIKKMSRDKLIAWYNRLFVPDNLTVCIAGNIDFDIALDTVEKYFGKEKASGEDFVGQSKSYKYSKSTIRTQLDPNEAQAIGDISFPSLLKTKENALDRYSSGLIASMFANYRSSVLFKLLRKDKGLLYSIGASQYSNINYPGLFAIEFLTSDDKIVEVSQIVLDEIKKLKTNGFTKEQFEFGWEAGNNKLKMGYHSLSDIVSWVLPGLFWFDEVDTLESALIEREEMSLDKVNEIVNKIFDMEYVNVISRVQGSKAKREIEGLVV